MDTGLSREESQRLLELLQLDPEHYGNWQLMRKSFLRMCKIMHPDKGGNPEAAKELITLYKKLENNISSLNPEECFTTSQVEKSNFFLYIKDWKECNMGLKPCVCIFCLTRKNHKERKNKNLIWGKCYCFACYCTWFGLEWCWFTWLTWRNIIAETPYHALNL
ncbi:small t antigen [Bat polyomavirus 6b]|uniref:Small t antigen n=1 Tax=Bat polyomavirus 6b TaxID=1623689 RepID=A0A0D5ZZ45_9POLY|nr:small t antigen [Bat polyomavirus 6b]BAQ55577.1 small t antigen [Bat polyomavirus 6b]